MNANVCLKVRTAHTNRIKALLFGQGAFAGHPVRLRDSGIVAADVDPSIIIHQHIAVVIVPVVGVPNSPDEAMAVPPMNTGDDRSRRTEDRC